MIFYTISKHSRDSKGRLQPELQELLFEISCEKVFSESEMNYQKELELTVSLKTCRKSNKINILFQGFLDSDRNQTSRNSNSEATVN
jgi:hypothetical protein